MINFPDNVIALQEANDDFNKLDRSQQLQVIKAIQKTSRTPKPKPEGLGTPLRKELAGFCKIKLKKAGIRVVYRYLKASNGMLLIVIAMRADEEAYTIAEERIEKHPEIFSDL